jgi:DNA-binding NtrC family response regulator
MSRESYRILIVDDERSILLLLKRILDEEGYTVKTASNGDEALRVSRNFKPHLIITDLKMPVMDGMTLIERFKAFDTETDFIVLTAYGTIDTAIKSMKMGASDYILKPLKEPDELRHAIRKAYERRRLMDENLALKTELGKGMPPLDIIFAGMEDSLNDIKAVATTNATVLLSGETGTGKSLIAKVIHNLSGKRGPFVEINCPSVPENLLESEFFGHEKGAFTGAISSKKGKFELAMGGTIFLDEISELHHKLQAKLLKVLQDGTFERVGSNITQKTDARIICATNRDLYKEVSEGRFRNDLFFRLNVFPIEIKPLRERKAHLPLITEFLVRTISSRIGKKINRIPEKAMEKIISYNWPGNIRELQNVLERTVILSKGEELDMTKVLLDESPQNVMFHGTLKDLEKRAIEDALKQAGGNRKKTAQILGISLRSLQYKIKEYRLRL